MLHLLWCWNSVLWLILSQHITDIRNQPDEALRRTSCCRRHGLRRGIGKERDIFFNQPLLQLKVRQRKGRTFYPFVSAPAAPLSTLAKVAIAKGALAAGVGACKWQNSFFFLATQHLIQIPRRALRLGDAGNQCWFQGWRGSRTSLDRLGCRWNSRCMTSCHQQLKSLLLLIKVGSNLFHRLWNLPCRWGWRSGRRPSGGRPPGRLADRWGVGQGVVICQCL